MNSKVIEGSPSAGARRADGKGARFALVVGRWNSFVVDGLERGAIDTLLARGVSEEHITVIRAPGAFEIPLVCREAARSGGYDAIIALGAVIRGDTPHFEYVAGECARGLAKVMEDCALPVAFGVLTVDTVEQAVARSGPCTGAGGDGGGGGGAGGEASTESSEGVSPEGKGATGSGGKAAVGNKGEEAALAALEMVSLLDRL